MPKFEIHGKDGNEDVIIDAFRAVGCTVQKIGRPLDLLVAVDEQTGLVEVKMPKGKLRPTQQKFVARWPGLWAIVRTPEEAFGFARALKRRAREQRIGQRYA